MSDISEILSRVYFGNTVEDYCLLAGMILLGFLFQKFLSKLLSNLLFRILKKFAKGVEREQFFKLVHKPLASFIMLIIFYFACSFINFPKEWKLAPVSEFGLRLVIYRIYQLFLIGSISLIIMRMVDFIGLVLIKRADKTESKQDDQLIPFAMEVIKVVIIIFAVFFVLGTVFKINVGSLVAGLGIGGLAIALAAKESLENLFGSFTIFFDKPFVVGDMVKVGDVTGIVEKVGFRSTRIRTLEKSYVTVPNKKMIDAELDNLTLRTFRRVDQTIGVLYGTPKDKIKSIVADIQNFINEHPRTNQEGQARFMEFGSSSLDILVIYYIDTMEWPVFLEVKEEINFKIMEIVETHGSDFAFPTQTVHIDNNN